MQTRLTPNISSALGRPSNSKGRKFCFVETCTKAGTTIDLQRTTIPLKFLSVNNVSPDFSNCCPLKCPGLARLCILPIFIENKVFFALCAKVFSITIYQYSLPCLSFERPHCYDLLIIQNSCPVYNMLIYNILSLGIEL